MATVPSVPTTKATKESSNFFRLCRLILDLGTHALQEKFDSLVPSNHLSDFLSNNKSILKKKPTVGGHGRAKLFPKNSRPCSDEFDISLLYILFRETRFTDQQGKPSPIVDPPGKGWGENPDSTDSSGGANIERLRQARNDLYGHALRAAIPDDDFAKTWTSLSSAIISIGGDKYEQEVANLRFTSLDPDGENIVQALMEVLGEDTLGKDAKLKRVLIKTRGEEDKRFVETRAFRKVEEEVSRNGAALIIGDPGEGKTSCAWHFILRRLLEGDELVIVDSPDEWRAKWDESKKQIIFIDDCFGQSHAIPDRVESWHRLQECLRGCINPNDTTVIATVRRHIYRDLKDAIGRLKIFGRTVDINAPELKLTPSEKLQIISNYFSEKNIEMDAKLIDILTSCETPRFPLSCRLIASDEKIQKKCPEFFLNPVSQLKSELLHLSEKDNIAFSSLVLLLISDNNLPYDSLTALKPQNSKLPNGFVARLRYICCAKTQKIPWIVEKMASIKKARKLQNVTLLDVHRALEKMRDTYVVGTDSSYKFVHVSILEAVGVILANDDAIFVLQHCSAHFIQQHVRVNSLPGVDEDTIVRLPEIYYDELSKRLVDDVINGDIDAVFQNPSIDDLYFSTYWFTYISRMERKQQLEFFRSVDRKGNTLLYWVGRSGNVNLLRFFLQHQEPTSDCLHGTCHSGNLDAITCVLNRGVAVDFIDPCGLTPLLIACQNENLHVAKLLLEQGSDVNKEQEHFGTPLHYACWNENKTLVRMLLEHGAKSNVVTHAGWPSIYFSGSEENFSVVQMLLKRRETINITANTGWSPLHLASGKGNTDIIQLLTENGADVNLTTTKGWSPLFCASQKGRHNVVNLLVKNGADLNQTDYFGVSCLHRVCIDGYEMVAKVLIQGGADVNIKSKVGYTPLHCACEYGNVALLHLLLQHGADINVKAMNGKTPIDIARTKQRDNILSALKEYTEVMF